MLSNMLESAKKYDFIKNKNHDGSGKVHSLPVQVYFVL